MTSFANKINGWVVDILNTRLYLFLVGIFFINIGINIGFVTSNSINIRGVEQNVIFSIQKAMSSGTLYTNPEEPPFAITQYTPLYYIVVAKIADLFKVIPGEHVSVVYLVGRFFSLITSLCLAIVIYITSRNFGASIFISLCALIFSIILPMPWFSLIRPDALVAFFGISAIVVYSVYLINWEQSTLPFPLLICGLLGFLAIFTKQNGVIFLIPIGFFSLIRFKLLELVYLLIGIIFPIILTSLIPSSYYTFNPVNDNFLFDNIIGGINNGISLPSAYFNLFSVYFSWYLPFFVIPTAIAISLIREIKNKGFYNVDQVSNFLALTYIIITTANLIAGLKVGSAIHYMNESMLISMLLIVRYATIKDLPSSINANLFYKNILMVYVICFLFFHTFDQISRYGRHLITTRSQIYDSQAINFLKNELDTNTDTFIFSAIPSINNVLFNHILFPQIEVSRISYSNGLLDYSGVQELIETDRLKYFVVPSNQYPPHEIFGNTIGNLKLIEEFPSIDIYVVQ